MKKSNYLFLFISLLCITIKVQALNYIDTNVESENAILYNVTDDLVMYEQNGYDRIKIASMTKIMTAIVAIENIDNLADEVVITDDDYAKVYEENLTVVGFEVGEKVTYRDLLYGLLFKSGADAAYALSNNIGNNEKGFVKMMNNKAKELGLKDTYFTNSVGYDEDNYSTVYDTMQFFKYALQNKTFKQIITDDYYTTSNNKFTLQNVIDELIDKAEIKSEYSQYVLGGKTGYTTEARNCLASYAEYDGTVYIVVTANVGSTKHIQDTMKLYEQVFKNYSRKKIIGVDEYLVSLTSYKDDKINVYSDKEIDVLLPNNANIKDVSLKYQGQNITKGVKQDDVLGKLNLQYGGEIIKTVDVVFNKKMQKAMNYKVVKVSTNKKTGHSIILVALSSIGGIMIIISLLIFISMYIDVKKNKRRWKF